MFLGLEFFDDAFVGLGFIDRLYIAYMDILDMDEPPTSLCSWPMSRD